MNKQFIALALALSVLPLTAVAQTDNSAPPNQQQRQQFKQFFDQFRQQEEQLHQQLRTQILADMTPVHRRAIGAEIGELAVSPNPDPDATVKRIDTILSPGERSRIVSAHAQFRNQTEQLHQQIMSRLKSQFPNMSDRHRGDGDRKMPGQMQQMMRDAGWIVLHSLPPHHDMGMPGMPGH